MLSTTWSMVAILSAVVVDAHTVITYPGWRGDNLILNDTFPYGMQWVYPCGGLPTSTNRTKWPLTGGGIAVQPGWFTGHETALMYINLGLGTDGPDGGPPNMSFPMVPPFEIIGPSDNPYPGMFCLPQVPLPTNVTVNVGDLATIQVVETAVHGGALYNCVDIIFALPEDVPQLSTMNCFNSSNINFKDPFSEASCTTSSANPSDSPASLDHWGVASCTSSSVFTTTVTKTAPASCPTSNGMSGTKEGLGVGIPLGVLAMGVLGL